ncbi:ATP-binding cassette domain-containing protein [Salimicrobium flavidum]|uniref:ATP-binding cassette domain-containing protein n=1 Tax=Salimicrobium flavidum TaxID=570947 RepID=UPI000A067D4C|nr:AAA family ATPase [Salimicrobium flavidum]
MSGALPHVPSGEVNVVLGANGAGKTTLFDMLAGAMKRPEGFHDMFDQEDICYQLQGFSLPDTLRGKDLFRLFLNTDDNSTYESPEQALHLELTDGEKERVHRLWNKKTGLMSVGERSWIMITSVCLLNRQLYLFDEPTSGLDPEARHQILRKINHLAAEGRYVIMSTHILHELKYMDTHIFFIHNGKLMFEGSYEEYLQRAGTDDPDIAFEQMRKQTS